MDNLFFDTNVLVYTVDNDSPEKQKRARSVVSTVTDCASPVISTQVLQEFYHAGTKKLKIDGLTAKSIVHDLRNMMVVQVTPDIIEHAIDVSIVSQLSFWDGLIITAAEYADCPIVLSEDMNDGQIINGVRILNPFVHKLPWES